MWTPSSPTTVGPQNSSLIPHHDSRHPNFWTTPCGPGTTQPFPSQQPEGNQGQHPGGAHGPQHCNPLGSPQPGAVLPQQLQGQEKSPSTSITAPTTSRTRCYHRQFHHQELISTSGTNHYFQWRQQPSSDGGNWTWNYTNQSSHP